MTVRRATPDDHGRLRAIQEESLAEPQPELLDAGLRKAGVLALVSGEPPSGYAIVVPGREEAYLAELAVGADDRGEGHGSALLSEITERVEAAELTLTVRSDDRRARSFYLDHGFVVRETLPGHFEDGNGLLLARDL